MSRHQSSLRDSATVGELPPDLYVAPGPWPRLGRPVKHDVATRRVIDDWPAHVPVMDAEMVRSGGWGEIRTHGTLTRTPVFKTGALNRSATHPISLRNYAGTLYTSSVDET
jgi:hypothetical protein